MAGTEIGRVTAKVRTFHLGRLELRGISTDGGYVAVELSGTKKPTGVRLTTYDSFGKEIGSTFHIKASAIMLEAALKAAIKEMK
jgi:hypothetical protein